MCVKVTQSEINSTQASLSKALVFPTFHQKWNNPRMGSDRAMLQFAHSFAHLKAEISTFKFDSVFKGIELSKRELTCMTRYKKAKHQSFCSKLLYLIDQFFKRLFKRDTDKKVYDGAMARISFDMLFQNSVKEITVLSKPKDASEKFKAELSGLQNRFGSQMHERLKAKGIDYVSFYTLVSHTLKKSPNFTTQEKHKDLLSKAFLDIKKSEASLKGLETDLIGKLQTEYTALLKKHHIQYKQTAT
ncbi:MAG: hypothetical protein MRY21_07570 [Simkaniaceae bacterium]|nr:hypothetical protein [Simkaniaceae bacterium]